MSDAPLVIEYVLAGEQRGYNFTTPTRGYSEDVLKVIWRSAMPRGQGWGKYIGAESLKGFALPDGRYALCSVSVTDNTDESGRKGIRRAEISVYDLMAYRAALRRRFETLPVGVQDDARFEHDHLRRRLALNRIDRKASRLALTHPYDTLADWRFVEALAILLTLEPLGTLKGWRAPVSLTTLALSHREESALVGLPQDRAAAITNADKTDTLAV